MGKIIQNNDNISNNKFNVDSIQENTLSTCSSVGNLIVQNVECQEQVLKLMFVGSKESGKSRLINSMITKNDANYKYTPTLGYSF